VNINPAYRLAELEYALNKVNAAGSSRPTGSEQATILGCSEPWRRSLLFVHLARCGPSVCRI
jgi:hypothetical protein